MPTLSDILGNKATVAIPFGENSLNVAYKPDMLTQESMATLQIIAGFTDDMTQSVVLEKFAEYDAFVAKLLISWDLLEDDGVTVMPITVDRLLKINPIIIQLIVRAILGNLSPNLQAALAQKS